MSDLPAPELSDPQAVAAVLGVLGCLFLLRVLGQLAVARGRATRLPPMAAWSSGIIPYERLLAVQVVFVVAIGAIVTALAVEAPEAVRGRPAVGAALVVAAYAYAGAMVVRYAVRMWRRPRERWTGGTIPILAHLVLAGFLLVGGGYLRSAPA